MLPKPKEIYLCQIPYRQCQDIRPCVIVEIVSVDLVKVALISSAMDLYISGKHFLLPSNHPDFGSSGLKRTSYILDDPVFEITVGKLGKRLGRIEGKLAQSFAAWIG